MTIEYDRDGLTRARSVTVELVDEPAYGLVRIVPPAIRSRPDDVHPIDDPARLRPQPRPTLVRGDSTRRLASPFVAYFSAPTVHLGHITRNVAARPEPLAICRILILRAADDVVSDAEWHYAEDRVKIAMSDCR